MREEVVTKFEIVTARFRMKPSFAVIGTTKGATTSVHDYLIRHPQILEPKTKEIRYFDYNYHKGKSWYLAHFPMKPREERTYITGESTPNYIYLPSAIARMAGDYPQIKSILVLRDPIMRALSDYNMERSLNQEDIFQSFEELVDYAYFNKWMKDSNYLRVRRFLMRGYIERGFYIEQIKNYLRFFNGAQLHISITEELQADPAKEMNAIYEFLGLNKFELEEYPHANVGNYVVDMTKDMQSKLQKTYSPFKKDLEKFLGRKLPWI